MPTIRRRIYPIILLLAGCSERQVEPDYSELIADACMSACPVTTECTPDPYYASVEECISKCSTGEGWEVLNQCDSRHIELSFCVGGLTCEEYDVYLMTLGDDDPSPPPTDYICFEQQIAFQNCDPAQPFEDPE